jgi:membrane-bound metal-dependent hydrolase YbcI (DUF457 family)
MADYRTHVCTSGLIGVGVGIAAPLLGGFTPVQGALAGVLTAVAGMLPDLDSQSGRPVREVFGLTAALAPVVLMERLRSWSGDAEGTMLLAILLYIAIRYGAGTVLGMIAVHRGMYHSIPAMFIAAELTFLGYMSEDVQTRLLMAGGVLAGFLSHLILDEVYSVEWSGLAVKLKSSAGSAVKLWGKSFPANVFTYGLLFTLTYAVMVDGGLWKTIGDRVDRRTNQSRPSPNPRKASPKADAHDNADAVGARGVIPTWEDVTSPFNDSPFTTDDDTTASTPRKTPRVRGLTR